MEEFAPSATSTRRSRPPRMPCSAGSESAPGPAIALREHPALAELDNAGVERVAELSERRHVAAGELLARNGDPADSVFLLTAGRASVLRRAADGTPVRAATLAAGALVGDLALADRAPRSADVKADTDIELFVPPLAALDRLGAETPRIETALLRSALHEASRTALRLEGELSSARSKPTSRKLMTTRSWPRKAAPTWRPSRSSAKCHQADRLSTATADGQPRAASAPADGSG